MVVSIGVLPGFSTDASPLIKQKAKRRVSCNSIRSKGHQIYSINQTKYAVSNYDNKPYWLNDCESLPYGQFSINDLSK